MTRSTGCDSLARGFSAFELVVAMAITLVLAAAVFSIVDPAAGAFRLQPEAADLEQRLRVATDAIARDIQTAGAGAWVGPLAGAFGRVAPGIIPYRVGRRLPDPAGSFHRDRLTVVSVPLSGAQSTLAAPAPAADGTTQVTLGPGCPGGDAACGFRAGSMVVLYDATGAWDLFTVAAASGPVLSLQHNGPDSPKVYAPGETTIAEATSHSYYIREDPASNLPQLVRYDGAGGGDVPVVSHVVSLSIEYLGEAEPPAVLTTGGGAFVRTTYGPPPPPLEQQPTAYPPGENCVFARTPSGGLMSRLSGLRSGPILVPLSPTDLTDGPWCPDELSPGRYDADLLRVRTVVVRLRVQAAIASMRGATGQQFARAGTATGSRTVPDREATLVVSSRPLSMVW